MIFIKPKLIKKTSIKIFTTIYYIAACFIDFILILSKTGTISKLIEAYSIQLEILIIQLILISLIFSTVILNVFKELVEIFVKHKISTKRMNSTKKRKQLTKYYNSSLKNETKYKINTSKHKDIKKTVKIKSENNLTILKNFANIKKQSNTTPKK